MQDAGGKQAIFSKSEAEERHLARLQPPDVHFALVERYARCGCLQWSRLLQRTTKACPRMRPWPSDSGASLPKGLPSIDCRERPKAKFLGKPIVWPLLVALMKDLPHAERLNS